VNPDPVR